MKFPFKDGKIITIKFDSKAAREYYAQSLKVTPYSLKMPTNNATQIHKVLDFPKEHDIDRPKESYNVQTCHNIKDTP